MATGHDAITIRNGIVPFGRSDFTISDDGRAMENGGGRKTFFPFIFFFFFQEPSSPLSSFPFDHPRSTTKRGRNNTHTHMLHAYTIATKYAPAKQTMVVKEGEGWWQ